MAKKVFSPTSNGIVLSPQIHHAGEASSSDGQQKLTTRSYLTLNLMNTVIRYESFPMSQ